MVEYLLDQGAKQVVIKNEKEKRADAPLHRVATIEDKEKKRKIARLLLKADLRQAYVKDAVGSYPTTDKVVAEVYQDLTSPFWGSPKKDNVSPAAPGGPREVKPDEDEPAG
jgi:hypothetical protein